MAIQHNIEIKKGKGKVVHLIFMGLLVLGVPLQIFPFYWMLTNSVKYNADIIKIPPVFFTTHLYLNGFYETFIKYNLWNNIWNTILLCGGVILTQITISVMAAFSLSKLKPKFGKFILLFFVGTMMISPQALMFPLYLMMANFPVLNISLINNKLSYILISSAWGYSVFLFKGFFDNIPSDLIESAVIDGASSMRTFMSIIVPLSMPVFAVLILNTFLAVYNDLIMPMMLLPRDENWPLMVKVVMAQLNGNMSANNMYVLLTITTIPVLLIYFLAQKNITEGIATSGIKG